MKIEVKNDWEYLTYSFDGKDLDEKIGGKAILENGDEIKFQSEQVQKSYRDMGHVYCTRCYNLIATINFNNQDLDIPLVKLNLKEVIQ